MTKKQFTILLTLIFIFFPTFANAYTGQYSWDPIHVEIETPAEVYHITPIEQRFGEISNEDFIKLHGLNETYLVAPVIPVKTNNQICQDSYGSNSSWDGTKNNAGALKCNCKTGYVWNEQQASCGVAPQSLNDRCTQDYGQNSYYTGKMTYKNETICGCLAGYIWTREKCINIEEKNPICEINVAYVSGIPSPEDARRMYGPQKEWTCDCPDNYVWNEKSGSCIIAPIFPAKTGLEKKVAVVPEIPSPKSEKKIEIKQDQKIECKENEVLSLNKQYCIKIPLNAHAVESLTDVWSCDEGYQETNNSCILIKNTEEIGSYQINNTTGIIAKDNIQDKTSSEPEDSPKENKFRRFFKNIVDKMINWFD